ncbi:MAG: ABC-2 family transporter protein [Alphaproteobacteria bacterium]|nr:ABC-2 family transporter protein [Alphaproteobacteria bacterium]
MRTRDLPTLMKVGFAAMVAYRAEMLIWILTVTAPIISLLVWDRVAEGGPMGRFDQATLGRYFLATIVVRQFSGAWIAWVLNYEIRTGGLNAPLLKPSNPLWYYVAENLASHPFRLVVLVPLLGLLVLWRPEFAFIPDPTALALGVTAVALAWAINFASQVAFGALAFRLQQSLGLFNTWFGLSMLLSGYLFPLELAPRWARPVLNALPFRAMVATPVETLTGLRGPAEALQAVGVQALWLGFFTALAALLWRRGIRHYEAVGA